jgi:hypothetical protein
MATTINNIMRLFSSNGVMSTSWLESQGLSRTEQGKYVKSGWLTRMATGKYRSSNNTPTLYGALASYEKQIEIHYRIEAFSALELHGYSHYVTIGKPLTNVFTPFEHRLSQWMTTHNGNERSENFLLRYLMEILTTLRFNMVTKLLEQCSSFKVKRLFLYMAEKTKHAWFKLDLSNVSLGSSPMSLTKGGMKRCKIQSHHIKRFS